VYQAQAQVLFVGILVLALLGLSAWQIRTLRRHLALQEEMARQEQLAAVGGMAAVLALEIRNPLGGIKGVAQFLKEGRAGAADQAEMMQAIVVEATRLERLVNDLLTYARPRPPERRPTHLATTLHEVLSFVQAASDAAGVKVRVDLGEPPLRVLADPEQMKQLLTNLMLNAIQAMPNGGILTLTGRVRTRQFGGQANAQGPRFKKNVDEWVEIAVEDTGSGIPESDLPRVFEPFYTTRSKGTGLGLAICLQIVEAHGGSIRVARTGPAGTRIEVTLPHEGAAYGQ
jgi:two-component system sensor histidine kinase HydH